MVTSLPFLMLQSYPNFWFYPYTHASPVNVILHTTIHMCRYSPIISEKNIMIVGLEFELSHAQQKYLETPDVNLHLF